jgi:hypothetical protein
LPIQLQTTCTGKVSQSSVSRVERKFWNNFGHGFTPDRHTVFSNIVRRFEFAQPLGPISGQSGWLEMQFNPGGLPLVTGSAVVSNFSTNATLNPASIELTGGCIGDVSPPTSLVQFTNSTGLNDYFESAVFGSTLSFQRDAFRL